MTDLNPIFVKIDEYKEILDIVDVIKHKVTSAEQTLHKIKSIKEEEDNELLAWSDNLEEVKRKINEVRKNMFEPNY